MKYRPAKRWWHVRMFAWDVGDYMASAAITTTARGEAKVVSKAMRRVKAWGLEPSYPYRVEMLGRPGRRHGRRR